MIGIPERAMSSDMLSHQKISISQSMSVNSLEDQTLAGVGQPPTDQLFVNGEDCECRVVCEA